VSGGVPGTPSAGNGPRYAVNLFELLALVGAILGAILGGVNGYSAYGIWGAAVGVPVGLVLGFLVFPFLGILVFLIAGLPQEARRGVKWILRRDAGGPGPREDRE